MPATRFEFGANWQRFLDHVDEPRIAAAVGSLQRLIGMERLDGLRFLDVGSGSGLFSLAAQRLGATVHSFDYDAQSVACTAELRRRFGTAEPVWTIETGSALDAAYLRSLSPADIVYSWGVLHHTGDMWRAIALVAETVPPGGRLCLALYNDQGALTERWTQVKQLYQRWPRPLRPVLVAVVGLILLLHRVCGSIVNGLCRLLMLRNPMSPVVALASAVRRPDPRGMHRWYDLIDWVGGWPFEAARPEDVLRFLQPRGFRLQNLTTCGGKMGCNEYLFLRQVGPCPDATSAR